MASSAANKDASEEPQDFKEFKAGYRLGDVVTNWFARRFKSFALKGQIYSLRKSTLQRYPGIIAARNIDLMNGVNGWQDQSRNASMVMLSRALDEWKAAKRNMSTQHSHADTAVHVRIGDGLANDRQKPPPLARWAVLGGRVEHVHIVTGIQVDFGMTFLNHSVAYLLKMRSVLAGVGVHSTLRLGGAPPVNGDHG